MQQIDNPSPLLFSQTGNGPCTPRKSFDLRPSPTNPLRITCTIRIFTSHELRLFRDYGSEENLNLGNDRQQICGPVERKIAGFLQDYPVNGPRNCDPRFSSFAKKVYFFSFFFFKTFEFWGEWIVIQLKGIALHLYRCQKNSFLFALLHVFDLLLDLLVKLLIRKVRR